ncbi:hypothetical protein CR513_11766, partial [Mucuna pruriens]
MTKDIFGKNKDEFDLRLIYDRRIDGRTYNMPTVSKIATLIMGYFGTTFSHRDILVQKKDKRLQHVCELHPTYLPLQYPLLFAYGEDGYKRDFLHRNISSMLSNLSYHTITMREYVYNFTCNPNLIEIKRFLANKRLKLKDRHDIMTRVFRMKLQLLIEELNNMFPDSSYIDRIISVEIPNKTRHPFLYERIKAFIFHGGYMTSRFSKENQLFRY